MGGPFANECATAWSVRQDLRTLVTTTISPILFQPWVPSAVRCAVEARSVKQLLKLDHIRHLEFFTFSINAFVPVSLLKKPVASFGLLRNQNEHFYDYDESKPMKLPLSSMSLNLLTPWAATKHD
jgi:hypothetical protein